jgi:hypothetical protein
MQRSGPASKPSLTGWILIPPLPGKCRILARWSQFVPREVAICLTSSGLSAEGCEESQQFGAVSAGTSIAFSVLHQHIGGRSRAQRTPPLSRLHRKEIPMKKPWLAILVLPAVFALLGCADGASPLESDAAAFGPVYSKAGGAVKFVFRDVTFPDGTPGELEASSKVGKRDAFTTCSYFSDDYGSYLGYYHSAGFGSHDAGAVLEFCLENYEYRNQH